jgi:hypothetical protein
MPAPSGTKADMSLRDKCLVIAAAIMIIVAGVLIFRHVKASQGTTTVVNVPQFGKQRKMGLLGGIPPSQQPLPTNGSPGTPGAAAGFSGR